MKNQNFDISKPNNKQNGIIIRHESFGPLIWSHQTKNYYILDDNYWDCVDFNWNSSNLGIDQTHPLFPDLIWLGMDHGLEIIDHNSSHVLSAPLEFYFDYTWLCNLAKARCGLESFCYTAEFLGPTTMDTQDVTSVMNQLRDWGVMRVHLAGGEPLLRIKDLKNYLEAAQRNQLWTSVNSNAIMVDEQRMEVILDAGLKSLSFSIDGYDEETFAQVRGAGLFSRAIHGVRQAIHYRDLAHSNMQIAIKPTFTAETTPEYLRNIVKLSIDLGADIVKLANVERCQRHPKGHYKSQRNAYYSLLQEIMSLRDEYSDRIHVTVVNNPLTGCESIGIPGLTGCIGGQELLALNPNGDITPCLIHPRSFGNPLQEGITLQEFWETNTNLANYRNELTLLEQCSGCKLYSQCRSGSVTRRLSAEDKLNRDGRSGDFSASKDELCPADYLDENPGHVIPAQKRSLTPSGMLREVSVKHSL